MMKHESNVFALCSHAKLNGYLFNSNAAVESGMVLRVVCFE